MCKFGGDPAICLREEAICAKVYRQTDGRTTDAGRRSVALAHSWNELKIVGNLSSILPALAKCCAKYSNIIDSSVDTTSLDSANFFTIYGQYT